MKDTCVNIVLDEAYKDQLKEFMNDFYAFVSKHNIESTIYFGDDKPHKIVIDVNQYIKTLVERNVRIEKSTPPLENEV